MIKNKFHCVEWSLNSVGENNYRYSLLEDVLRYNLNDHQNGVRTNWKILFVSEDKTEILQVLEKLAPPIEEKPELEP